MDSAELEFVNHSLAVTTLAAQSQEEAENESPSTHSITFDCDGDITLVAGCYRLLVSSKVLTLASPVFRAMLEPGRFREGQTQRNSDNPFTVRLSDDNPESLILLCNLLHYKTIHTPSDIGLLSSFAVICDKYGCTPAMSSHAAFWRCAFDYSSSDMSALLQLLWVAYAFSNKPDFGKLSSKLAAALTTAEVESLQLPDGLPDSIKDGIRALRTSIMRRVQNTIETSVDRLRGSGPRYLTGRKICKGCEQVKPPPTKKCQRCKSRDFRPLMCSTGLRTGDFIAWLSGRNLWPLSGHMDSSAMEFPERVNQNIHFFADDHWCDGNAECPLEIEKRRIGENIARAIREAEGLKLDTYQVLS